MMRDIANNEVYAGDKVKILQCKEYPNLEERIVTVMNHQDCKGKIKVSFSDQWCGYFRFCDIIKMPNTTNSTNAWKSLFNRLIKNREADKYLVTVLKSSNNANKYILIDMIKHCIDENNIFKFLEDIDKNNEFTKENWFYFGMEFFIKR